MKLNKIITILLCLGAALCQGQIKITHIDVVNLSKEIKYEGKIQNAIKWVDKLGDNIVITTETGVYPNKNYGEANDAELFAYHFIQKGDSIKQTWKVYDFIKECPFTIAANYIGNTLQVTDLNEDGIGEIWLMYKTVCTSELSPWDMKIIMYQGQQKYAMRGSSKVKISDDEFIGGDYTFDKAFTEGPEVLRTFAKKLWNKNIMENWE